MFALNRKEAGVIPTTVLLKWYDKIKSDSWKRNNHNLWNSMFEST